MRPRYKDAFLTGHKSVLNGFFARLAPHEQREAAHDLRCINGDDISLPMHVPSFLDSAAREAAIATFCECLEHVQLAWECNNSDEGSVALSCLIDDLCKTVHRKFGIDDTRVVHHLKSRGIVGSYIPRSSHIRGEP